MTDPDPEKKTRGRGLVLERANRSGTAVGLRAGDVLAHVNGRPLDGNLNSLKEQLSANSMEPHLLGFWRGGQRWLLRSDSASFGRWHTCDLPDGLEEEPALPQGPMRNWEIWVTPSGRYDAQAVSPGVLAFLVPYYLLHMRLWSAFALWVAVLIISIMLGWVLGTVVQIIVWLYFWRAAPTLLRQEFMARGFRLWRVMAARSEAALHAELSETVPELRFAHGRQAA
ncbi:MAG: hypothetical protein AAGA15_00560 [Pseudomonadota bacterium]